VDTWKEVHIFVRCPPDGAQLRHPFFIERTQPIVRKRLTISTSITHVAHNRPRTPPVNSSDRHWLVCPPARSLAWIHGLFIRVSNRQRRTRAESNPTV
jgi:hypothetical protein